MRDENNGFQIGRMDLCSFTITYKNVFSTSTIKLPSEFSSTDRLTQLCDCTLLYLLGNTMNLEQSVVSRTRTLETVPRPKLASRGPETEHHALQFLLFSVSTETSVDMTVCFMEPLPSNDRLF
jgi:hypothetical protein